MLQASEDPVWPAMKALSAKLKADNKSDQDQAPTEMISQFPIWKLAVRECASESTMKDPAIAIIQARLQVAALKRKSEDELPHNDAELNVRLRHVRGLSTCSNDVRLSVALSVMKPFANAVSRSQVYIQFLQRCIDFAQLELADESGENIAMVEKAKNALIGACPTLTANKMSISKDDDKRLVSQLLQSIGSLVLCSWPGESPCSGMKVLLKSIASSTEVREPQFTEASVEPCTSWRRLLLPPSKLRKRLCNISPIMRFWVRH